MVEELPKEDVLMIEESPKEAADAPIVESPKVAEDAPMAEDEPQKVPW